MKEAATSATTHGQRIKILNLSIPALHLCKHASSSHATDNCFGLKINMTVWLVKHRNTSAEMKVEEVQAMPDFLPFLV